MARGGVVIAGLVWASMYGGYGGYGGYGSYGYGQTWQIYLTSLLTTLLYEAPVFGVWALGVLLAIVALRQSPVALILVISAFLLMVASVALDFSWLVVQLGFGQQLMYGRLQYFQQGATFAARLVEALSWALLLLAIPAGRIQKPEPPSAGEEQPAPL